MTAVRGRGLHEFGQAFTPFGVSGAISIAVVIGRNYYQTLNLYDRDLVVKLYLRNLLAYLYARKLTGNTNARNLTSKLNERSKTLELRS